MKLSRNTLYLAGFAVSTLILISPAMFLGYPILHGDTGSYISNGFRLIAPVERPVTYAFFVLASSLAVSLWFTVAVQALLTLLVFHFFLKEILKDNYHPVILPCIVLILTLTTGIGYFTCQIKPDFFLPLVVLSIFTYLIGDGKLNRRTILLGLIGMAGLLSHLTHIPIITGLIGAIFIISWLFKRLRVSQFIPKFLVLSVFIGTAWILAPSINYVLTGSFTFSRVSNIFSASRLLQAGIFQDYLKQRCIADTSFKFCQYVSGIDDYKKYYDFLWDRNSFLYDDPCVDRGKLNCWLIRDREFGEVVDDIYAQRKYRSWLAKDALHCSLEQFVSFEIPDYASYTRHSYPMETVKKYLPLDRYFLKHSRQAERDLIFKTRNKVQKYTVLFSLVAAAIVLVWKRKRLLRGNMLLLGLMIALVLVGNAVFIGIFGGSSDRFQGRLIWLLPFYCLVLAAVLTKEMWPPDRDRQTELNQKSREAS